MADRIDLIMAYEQGELDEDKVLALFQDMVNDGTVWHLQGHYGRTATYLIANGLIEPVRRA